MRYSKLSKNQQYLILPIYRVTLNLRTQVLNEGQPPYNTTHDIKTMKTLITMY